MNAVCERKEIGLLQKLAKAVRICTVPPVVVAALLSVLFFATDVLGSAGEYLLLLLGLAIFPVLAYPMQMLMPSWRAGGRGMQRRIAFVCSLIGYSGAVIGAALCGSSLEALYIAVVYLVSVVVLTLLNCLTPWHASGHACALMGPLLLITLFMGGAALPVTLLVYLAAFWASVYMGRHTVREFLLGSLSSMLATVLCYLILHPAF